MTEPGAQRPSEPGAHRPDEPVPTGAPALLELFEEAWPGISQAITRARSWGWDWWSVSQPFVRQAEEQVVAHVGLLRTTLLVAGAEHPVAGVHAVCTRRGWRRQGLCEDLLEEVVAALDQEGLPAFLTTAVPEVFEPHGFRRIPEHQWRLPVNPKRTAGKAPEPADPELLAWLCARRAPLSHRLCARDPGWLLGICEVLEAGDLSRVHLLTELEAAVVWENHGGRVDLLDVICERPLRVDELLPWLPEGTEELTFLFSPDLVAPEAVASPGPSPDGTVFMLRGELGLGEEPVALPPLARC